MPRRRLPLEWDEPGLRDSPVAAASSATSECERRANRASRKEGETREDEGDFALDNDSERREGAEHDPVGRSLKMLKNPSAKQLEPDTSLRGEGDDAKWRILRSWRRHEQRRRNACPQRAPARARGEHSMRDISNKLPSAEE